MTQIQIAHAAHDDWNQAAQECCDALSKTSATGPNQATLGLVYVTDYLADDLKNIISHLTDQTGISQWVGTVGMGICAGSSEFFDRPALAVMTMSLDEQDYKIIHTINDEQEPLPAAMQEWITKTTPLLGIVHGDGNNPNILHLVEEFASASGCFLVGGLTASRQTSYQIAGSLEEGGLTGGGLSGVLFAPSVEVATGLSQGCSPIGESHIVSDCVDNVIVGIDGRGALDVFKEDIGDVLARDLNRVAGYIHAAFPIEGSDTGDYLVRNLVGIDPEQGWLAVGGEIKPGERILFVRRDPQSAEEDFVSMLTKLKKRLPGDPKGGVYYSCIARGPNMFGTEGREAGIIHDILGDFPLIGFYANGEISNNRLYGYTGVIALFM
ncbi:FIST C-terminal domain-containing protein [bacterium]|jgi:small ligand-binding sensory domain FIST|nr:FIST C-terminal domain-containing protein [bacterium]